MKKIVVLLLVSFYAFSQTGIGTTTPINKLDIFTTKADPATSNSSANGNLRLGASGANTHVLDFGLSSTSTFSWMQARDRGNYATLYSLAFNPIGGNVGIGTSAPNSTLTVGNSTGTIPGEISINPAFTSNEGGQINIKKSLNGSTADWIIDQYGTTSSDARLRIFNSIAETNGITIMENGNIGMGSLTPSVRLQVAGDIIANSIAGSSDARFKTNISPIENPLQKVLQLRGVNFDWKTTEFPTRSFSENRSVGFIAQEVEKILPEVVSKDNSPEEYRSVKYDKVVALLVEAIKEQQKQIDSLKSQVKKLKRKKK
ncbi:tail fiber domain-containing protein [Aquirufa lenticrescens]|uniref:tail fiber domain-containing protein n=1 Tax=Aquirufa lenticrescens TaxID=2696560 RepID=UPI001CAA66E0|nr:tail fiber domain-containing protein [Aquirufa lenticrescens]UAJ14007.1 tail fiber domain-containing protein [Aquirufa lenticrescens]